MRSRITAQGPNTGPKGQRETAQRDDQADAAQINTRLQSFVMSMRQPRMERPRIIGHVLNGQ